MARKIINRLERRSENEAAERLGAETKAKKEPKKTDAAEKPKRKSRSKVAKEVRLKAFWGVYNQSLKRVAKFEYSQRPEADKKATELSASQKTPHFVKMDKEVIEE